MHSKNLASFWVLLCLLFGCSSDRDKPSAQKKPLPAAAINSYINAEKRQVNLNNLLQTTSLSQEKLAEVLLKQLAKYSGETMRKEVWDFGVVPTVAMDFYHLWQQQAAQMHPYEYDRPIIKVSFINPSSQAKQTIGLLGGMGPLSDAAITKKIAAKGPLHHIQQIHLLSMPPPRTAWEVFTGAFSYAYHLFSFSLLEADRFYLLSNTAHIYFKPMAWFLGSKLQHLAHKLSVHLQQFGETLVVGTSQAFKAKLYPELNPQLYLPQEYEQEKVQDFIVKVKEGRLQAHEHTGMVEYLSQHPAQNILLSCTEVPLGLNAEGIKQIQSLGKKIFDSESYFVDFITEPF